MTASWPATLPQNFTRDSFQHESADNLISSEMSVGPAKVRRRSTANVYKISGSMLMSGDQVADFRTFVSTTIKDGALSFTFPDPYGGADLLVRMQNTYTIRGVGVQWSVDLALEVFP